MDGGYYAIKGFEFQIDKNILEILGQSDLNKQINIEQKQDIDSAEFIMQIKYKEAAKFVPSAIKDPLIQLIEEYKKDNTKKYILYCHFADFNGYNENTSIETILGAKKSSYSKKQKTGFQSKFELKFAPQFDIQLEQTINKIAELGYDLENAIIHHSRLTQHLRDIVVNNTPTQITKRKCTKKELIDLIKNDRKIIYTSTYREYKGEQAYFTKLKREYFTSNNLNKFFTVIVIELHGAESLSDFKSISLGIKNKFYKKNTLDIKGEAPFIFFRNINQEKLIQLKVSLIQEGNILKDGFDFEHAKFNISSFVAKATKENLICLKVINDESLLKQLLNADFSVTREVFQFYISKPLEIEHTNKEVEIKIKEINDILKIL